MCEICLQTWLSLLICNQHRSTHRNSGQDGFKTKSLIDHITDCQNNSVTQIFCKTNGLTESLRHAKWTGAMARLEQGECVQSPDTWQVFPSECLFPRDAGACPWLVCMFKKHWRYGPNAWPMPGLGGFARSHNSTGVVLQLLLVGPLTECGLVALTELAKFLETDTGMRLAAKHLVLSPLEPGTVAWVPYGYICIPSALQTQQSKTTADIVWNLTNFNRTKFALLKN